MKKQAISAKAPPICDATYDSVRRALAALAILVTAMLIAPASVHADAAPTVPAVGANTMLLTPHPWIRLLEETIHINLGNRGSEVQVDYLFHCDGPGDDVVLGFPNKYYPTHIYPIEDFQAIELPEAGTRGRNELHVRPEDLEGATELEVARANLPWREDMPKRESFVTEWLECFRTGFEADGLKVLVNRYTQGLASEYRATYRGRFSYILHTGSYWHGPIERLTVLIDGFGDASPFPLGLPVYNITPGNTLIVDRYPGFRGTYAAFEAPEQRDRAADTAPSSAARPERYELKGGTLSVTYSDLEPDFDISFYLPLGLGLGAEATSVLPEGGSANYLARNVLDEDRSTSWVEGVDGPGIGERITVRFSPIGSEAPGCYGIRRIGIINGYAASDSLYRANNRIKRVRITYWAYAEHRDSRLDLYESAEAFEFDLEDTPAMQHVELPRTVPACRLTFEIVEVYPGSRWDDTCIAEIAVESAELTQADLDAAEWGTAYDPGPK